MSDLHNEFERGSGPRAPTDAWLALDRMRRSVDGHPDVGPMLHHLRGENVGLIVMAGDIDVNLYGIAYADSVARYLGVPVVCVYGNHEGYPGRDLDLLIPEMRAAARATGGRVTFLENEAATFLLGERRVHVLGCCLFTDYALNCLADDSDAAAARVIQDAMNAAALGLNDHRRIFLRGSRFSPSMARQVHDVSRQWLGRQVKRLRAEEGDGATILIVTHHAPIPDANPPQYRGGKVSPAFASDMRAEIAEWRPAAWIWGHTHYSMDAVIGRTRLISSQRGYVCMEPGADDYLPQIIEL